MKHITIIPDCPRCGQELRSAYKRVSIAVGVPASVDGWWECSKCGYESEHMDHNPNYDIKTIVEPIEQEHTEERGEDTC